MAKRRGRKPLINHVKTQVYSLTLRPDVIAWVDRVAAMNNRTRSNVITTILLEKMEFGAEIELSGGLQKVLIKPEEVIINEQKNLGEKK